MTNQTLTNEEDTRFSIGDYVWCATTRGKRESITCPDCFGTRTLKVTLGDDTEMEIECSGCSAGYEPPCGSVQTWDYLPSVEHHEVTGVSSSLKDGKEVTEYRCGHRVFEHLNTFKEKEEADVRAKEMTKESQDQEEKKISQKEKPTRTWSWHVHYHRRQIRDAKKNIEYHSKKLDAANLRVRKTKENTTDE